MRISIDRDKCIAAGLCVLTEPTTFDQADDDGLVVLLKTETTTEAEPAVRKAAWLCPSGAITAE